METNAQEQHLLDQMQQKRDHQTTQQPKQVKLSRKWANLPPISECKEQALRDEEALRERLLAGSRLHEALNRAGIPEKSRFRRATLDNYETPTPNHARALEMCRTAAERFNDGNGVLLVGEPGGGKTHLLVGLLRAAIDQHMTAKYLTLSDFFAMMRGCISKGKADLDCIEELARVEVLALDDIYSIASAKSGTEQSYQYEKLWHLLDKRYFNGNATLASTNHDIAGFREMIDERTRRRLQAVQIPVPKFTK